METASNSFASKMLVALKGKIAAYLSGQTLALFADCYQQKLVRVNISLTPHGSLPRSCPLKAAALR